MSRPRKKLMQAAFICNTRAKEADAAGTVTWKDIDRVWAASGWTCEACGQVMSSEDPKLSIDHATRLCDGGTNSPENLRTLCMRCNQSGGGLSEGNAPSKPPTPIQKRVVEVIARNPDVPITQVAEKALVTRQTIYNTLANPKTSALIETRRTELAKKSKGLLGISEDGLEKCIRKLDKHLDVMSRGEHLALSPGEVEDLIRIASTLGGVVKMGKELGLDDKSDEVSPQERHEAAVQILRAVVRGMLFALADPERAAAYLPGAVRKAEMEHLFQTPPEPEPVEVPE